MDRHEVKVKCDAAVEAIASLPEDQRLAWLGYIAKRLSVREEQSNLVLSGLDTLQEREDLSRAARRRLRRALTMHVAERRGEVVHLPWDNERAGDAINLKGERFEFWINSTAAAKGESGERYGGQVLLSGLDDPLSVIETSCQCKDYQAERAYHNGVIVCKHVFWAAIKAALGEFQNVEQIEIHHNSGELKAVKINGCKLRRAQADFGAFKEYVERAGMGAWSFPRHGKDIPLDSRGLYGRVYTKKISDE